MSDSKETELNPPYLGDPNTKRPEPQMLAPLPAVVMPSPRQAEVLKELDKIADELEQTPDGDTTQLKHELAALIGVVRGVIISQGQ